MPEIYACIFSLRHFGVVVKSRYSIECPQTIFRNEQSNVALDLSQRGGSPRDRGGWPASLPYICKIHVSMAIGTQSGIHLHERVPTVKIWGSSKMTKIGLQESCKSSFSQFFILLLLFFFFFIIFFFFFSFDKHISITRGI